MTKHGLSHGAATLITFVTAGLLLEEIRELMPRFSLLLQDVAFDLAEALPVPIEPNTWAVVLAASVLAVIWGILFGFVHR